jgi:hypothetical protein
MRWTVVPFGRYKEKTLPEIIIRDLDRFISALPKLCGKVASPNIPDGRRGGRTSICRGGRFAANTTSEQAAS